MITTAILARNEVGNDLREVLTDAQRYSDEILLLDDGSTDGTPGLARQLGCQVKTRKSPKGMWGNETPARKELWDWGSKVAKDGWLLIQDADMLLVGDPRPLTRSTVCNAWAWVLYDCWSSTTYREDGYWQGHRVPRPWMVCPSRVPEGWMPQWPDKGIHCGHIPPNFPMLACAVEPNVLSWKHLAYSTDERRVAKWRQYLAKADQLTPFERQHAESILPPDHPARGEASRSAVAPE